MTPRVKNVGAAIALLVLVLGAHGLVDAVERSTESRLRDQEDRLAYRQWVSDSCTPTDSAETAIVKRDGAYLRCRIYRNAAYGMAPNLVSVAVMEIPL